MFLYRLVRRVAIPPRLGMRAEHEAGREARARDVLTALRRGLCVMRSRWEDFHAPCWVRWRPAEDMPWLLAWLVRLEPPYALVRMPEAVASMVPMGPTFRLVVHACGPSGELLRLGPIHQVLVHADPLPAPVAPVSDRAAPC